MYGILAVLVGGLWGWSACAQEVIREGDMERLVLASGATAEAWHSAEATMTAGAERTRVSPEALVFRVEVDYFEGEPQYPIGWPRSNMPLREAWQRDWSAFDLLRISIYTETSREALPAAPMGLNLYTPDRASAYARTLTELGKDEWVTIEIPLSQIPRHDDVTTIQIFISEANYEHGDTLAFYIDDISLWRHAVPTVMDLVVAPAVMFADAGQVVVSFRAAGISAEAEVEARATLIADGAPVPAARRHVARGPVLIVMTLEGDALPEGHYTVRVQLADGEPQERPLRAVVSPWAQ